MRNYVINIAKAYTMSDWRDLPAHRHHAKLVLADALPEADAKAELERLTAVYPWPEYHLSLRRVQTVTTGDNLTSSAPADFLEAHQWSYDSIHEGKRGDYKGARKLCHIFEQIELET